MLNYIIKSTEQYLETIPKSKRKKIGQFFTSKNAAIFMANLFKENIDGNLCILDPGAGTGILSAALMKNFKVMI